MTRSEGSARLKEVAEYRAAHRTLRIGAIGSLIFGGLTLAIALAGPRDPFLTTVGAILIATGAWGFLAPRPIGIVLDGLTLVTVGGYNFAAFMMALLGERVPAAELWGTIGALQFALGVHGLARLLQYGGAFRPAAGADELRDLEAIMADIRKAPLMASPEIIEISVRGLRNRTWRVSLEPDAVVILSGGGARVCEAGAFDIDVIDDVADPRPVRIYTGTSVRRGSMSPESLERYRQWKQDDDLPEALAA